MNDTRTSRRCLPILILWACLSAVALTPTTADATAEGSSAGSLVLEITSPATVPPGFVLNPGGTTPSSSAFPDAGNSGNGAFTGIGSAGCTPAGCTSPAAGTDLEYQLANDLTCTAEPAGTYGGLEDSFALFGASNDTGGSVTLGLRFTTSWSVSATVEALGESAEASVDLLWAVPTDFCILLTSCPAGTLSGGSPTRCPGGFLTGTTLVLGTGDVATTTGSEMDAGPASVCDVTVVVLAAASSGGDLSVTSSCLATSSGLIFMDGFESGNMSSWTSR